ncbi:MAG: response regulator [Rhodocyclaceae bacterium]
MTFHSDARARILVIDDELQIRRFLRIGLRSQGYVVSEADTAAEGARMASSGVFDLVILDLGLPDADGKTVLAAVRRVSSVPVIVLSVRASEAEKVAALDGGANDYVTKPFGVQELFARVCNLLRHHAGGQTTVAGFDDGRVCIDLVRRLLTVDGEAVQLGRKEYAVLAALAAHPGEVVTQSQLLRDIWGPTHVAHTHYLRIVVAKLRQRLGDAAGEPRYILTEPGVGYRFIAEGGAPPSA